MIITHLYLSPAHAFAGRFGQGALPIPMREVDRVQVVAGRGLVGDRYSDRDAGHKGQVTFFSEEVWLRLQEKLARTDRGPEVFRRNVIVRGVDLMSLIGAEFEVQGVRFQGSEHCTPCVWMNEAFGPGALAALAEWSAGGLRARALSDGWLHVDPVAAAAEPGKTGACSA